MYEAKDYERRAEECVRLASITTDSLIERELLNLRQTYLQIAARLAGLGEPDDL